MSMGFTTMGVMGDRSLTKFRIGEKSPPIFLQCSVGHPSTPSTFDTRTVLYDGSKQLVW